MVCSCTGAKTQQDRVHNDASPHVCLYNYLKKKYGVRDETCTAKRRSVLDTVAGDFFGSAGNKSGRETHSDGLGDGG